MLSPAYDRLKRHLGLNGETELISRPFQYALLDEAVMQRFGSDGRPLLAGPAPSTLACELPGDAFIDPWAVTYRRVPGLMFYDPVAAPLREAGTDDLDN